MKLTGRLINSLMCLLPISFLMGARKASADRPKVPRPNVLLVMVDDMGFSDLGCYGGEINTPNIDGLAAGGLRYTSFYNTGRCCPSRASLMTGLYAHQAGMGWMTRVDMGRFPYQGQIAESAVTLAEVLANAGYTTHMAGKWHLTQDENMEAEGPKDSWPLSRGFESYYGALSGGGGYYKPQYLTRGDTRMEAPEGFYYTKDMTEHTLEFIQEYARGKREKPFFFYLAHYAPHRPLHALPEDIAKYRGRYDAGWDEIREARYRKMLEMGLIDETWKLSKRDAPAWRELDEKEKHNMARRMEVYAAQIDRVDQGIGEIVDALKEAGLYEDTLILFLSDNGGCAEHTGNRNVPENMGAQGTDQSYRTPWANVSNTPLRLYKSTNHEGGIAAPLIAHWPKGIDQDLGGFRKQTAHIIDIMPTLVELTEAQYPKERDGRKIPPMEGMSLVPSFSRDTDKARKLYFEHESARAVIDGRFKLVTVHGKRPRWELYDLSKDRSETDDLSRKMPGKARKLARLWEKWGKRAGVTPVVEMGWNERVMAFVRPMVLHTFDWEFDRGRNHTGHAAGTEGMRSAKTFDGRLVLDFKPGARWYSALGKSFDARELEFIRFKVRGREGGEEFSVGTEYAPPESEKRPQAFVPVSRYAEIGKEWCEVRVPLKDLAGLDLSRLHAILLAEFKGEGTIEIDDVALEGEKMNVWREGE